MSAYPPTAPPPDGPASPSPPDSPAPEPGRIPVPPPVAPTNESATWMLLKQLPKAPVTACLMVTVAAAHVLLLYATGGDTATWNHELVSVGAVERSRIWAGEYWRFVTAAFLNTQTWVMLLNLWAIFIFSAMYERRMGSWRTGVVWLFGCTSGAAVTIITRDVVAVGTGLPAAGLFGALLVAIWNHLDHDWNKFLRDGFVRINLLLLGLVVGLSFTPLKFEPYGVLGAWG